MPQNVPSPYATPGPYTTTLAPDEEQQFQGWVKSNKLPWQDGPTSDYDMRGFWKAQQAGDPNARRAANLHFPDTYKTPYHKSFSNESKYATKRAPHWEGDKLVPTPAPQRDERIDKALKDPAFLALGEDEQISVLKHYKENPAPAKAAASPNAFKAGIGPPPKVDEGIGTKLGRGAALGTAAGLGIPESTDWKEVTGGAVANAAKGYGEMAKSVAGYAAPPKLDAEGIARTVAGPLGPTALNVGKGIYGAGAEAWKGLKDKDPEGFAHGFASMATQVLTLAAMRKGKISEGEIKPGMRQARISSAIDAGAEEHLALEKAMSRIVPEAKSAGVHSVRELGKVLKDAHTRVNAEFEQGFAPIRHQRLVPMDISRKVLDLITPDMRQTAEGRMSMQKIRDAATEYQKDWSLDELNERRKNVDKQLSSHYQKASMGQYADPIEAEIREAERQGAADVVYKKWGQANPGKDARLMKQQHGALWKLDDAINGEKGAVNTLKAKQGNYRAEGGRLGQLRGGANFSKTGVHGYLGNFVDALFGGGGPETRANTKVRKAFNPSLTSRAAKLGVIGFPAAHQLSPPPQADEQ